MPSDLIPVLFRLRSYRLASALHNKIFPAVALLLVSACAAAGMHPGTPVGESPANPTVDGTPAHTPVPTVELKTKTPGGGSFGELVFSDEFDGSALDAAKWKVHDGHPDYWPETPWRRNYKKENVYLADGALVIRTRKESVGFSTGAIGTGDEGEASLFEQAFGRYEARLRFPSQPGYWCAFWLWSTGVENVDGTGRDGTEIDILERAWLIDRAEHALHWDGYGAAHRSAEQYVDGLGMNDGGWHTVRLDWYPDLYVFYIDGKESWRTQAGGVSQAPNFVILSCEIGNFGTGPDAWGVGPIETAALPDYFYVDYLRVYRYLPPPE
jgi:beta-glucanase (GH16 family)